MDLWIRTQNKKDLIPIKHGLYVSNDDPEEHCIYHSHNLHNQYCRDLLGIYNTEKRALEVLDEIQEKLMIRKINETSGIEYILCQDLVPIIYEMPEE